MMVYIQQSLITCMWLLDMWNVAQEKGTKFIILLNVNLKHFLQEIWNLSIVFTSKLKKKELYSHYVCEHTTVCGKRPKIKSCYCVFLGMRLGEEPGGPWTSSWQLLPLIVGPRIRSTRQTTVLITGIRHSAWLPPGSKCQFPAAHGIIHQSHSCRHRRSSNPVITKPASHSPCLFTLPKYAPHAAPVWHSVPPPCYGYVRLINCYPWHLPSVRYCVFSDGCNPGAEPPLPRWKEGNQNAVPLDLVVLAWLFFLCELQLL